MTADDLIYEIDEIARDYDNYEYGFPTHDEKSMEDFRAKLDAYTDRIAEKARREERARHKDIVDTLKWWLKYYSNDFPLDIKVGIEDTLKEAGYEIKEES